MVKITSEGLGLRTGGTFSGSIDVTHNPGVKSYEIRFSFKGVNGYDEASHAYTIYHPDSQYFTKKDREKVLGNYSDLIGRVSSYESDRMSAQERLEKSLEELSSTIEKSIKDRGVEVKEPQGLEKLSTLTPEDIGKLTLDDMQAMGLINVQFGSITSYSSFK